MVRLGSESLALPLTAPLVEKEEGVFCVAFCALRLKSGLLESESWSSRRSACRSQENKSRIIRPPRRPRIAATVR
jgi:hypothetical protein